jgi:hypothetical protein
LNTEIQVFSIGGRGGGGGGGFNSGDRGKINFKKISRNLIFFSLTDNHGSGGGSSKY